ncbi:MAG TPA: hypothetical protein VEH06_16615 [Candidatus Bathyarchaeia archaeon]|jgi:hypothetical protein|nr:hypothetical protein [Candidatus Bathyarchaeia archaeon]
MEFEDRFRKRRRAQSNACLEDRVKVRGSRVATNKVASQAVNIQARDHEIHELKEQMNMMGDIMN